MMLLMFQHNVSFAQENSWGDHPVLDTNLDNAPAISVCGEKQTYTVTVKRGGNACPSGTLRIHLPEYFEYVQNTVATSGGGATATFHSYNPDTRVLQLNVNIPAATSSNATDIKLSFDAVAKCGAIALANLPQDQKPRMMYTLQGCTQSSGGTGQTINILYAVLNLEVTPMTSIVNIGEPFTRTVKITNNGNGSVQSFKVKTQLPSSILRISSAPTVVGWSVSYSNGEYHFTNGNLAVGQTVVFTEQLQANSCEQTDATYQAIYGCGVESVCSFPDLIGTVRKPTVNVDIQAQPSIVLTSKALNSQDVCLDQDLYHQFTIKNTGTVSAKEGYLSVWIEYNNSQDIFSYLLKNTASYSYTEDFTNPIQAIISGHEGFNDGMNGNIDTTDGSKWVNFYLPNLAPGETIYARIAVRTKNYDVGTSCEAKKETTSYGYTHFAYYFKNANLCVNDNEYKRTETKVSGNNYFTRMSPPSLVSDSYVHNGEEYEGQIKFSTFYVSEQSIDGNIDVDLVVQFAPNMTVNPSSIKLVKPSGIVVYTPVDVVSEANNTYRLKFKMGQGGWAFQTRFLANNGTLKFKATYNCTTPNEPTWVKIYSEVTRLSSCATTIATKCYTFNITGYGCDTSNCTEGGMIGGKALAKRVTLGHKQLITDYQVNPINNTPVLPLQIVDPATEEISIKNFSTNDQIEISKAGIVLHTAQSPINGWHKGEMKFDVSVGLRKIGQSEETPLNNIVIPNSGKVVFKRGGESYTLEGLPVETEGQSLVKLQFTIADLQAKGLPTTITGFENDDELVASVVLQPSIINSNKIDFHFQPIFSLIDESNVFYRCGLQHNKVVMHYVPVIVRVAEPTTGSQYHIGLATFNMCWMFAPPIYLDVSVNGVFNSQNPGYPNEYRRFVLPKKLKAQIPEGIVLRGFRLYLHTQNYYPKLYAFHDYDLPTPVSGDTVEWDIETFVKNRIEANEFYLDEGFRFEIYPKIEKKCSMSAQEQLSFFLS